MSHRIGKVEGSSRMTETSQRVARVALVVALIIQLAIVLLTLVQTPAPPLYMAIRAAALLGYIGLFWLIVSSEYVRQMRGLLGRVYLKVHHPLSVVTWVLIAAHPLGFALFINDAMVLLPVFWPLKQFLQLAGRPALYLFALGTVGALTRRRLKRGWRYLHKLNYVAFALVFIHAWLIGTDLSNPLVKALWLVMAVVVLAVALHKGIGAR
jgi:sulfoxide reductase heme-binding subunit YedZ